VLRKSDRAESRTEIDAGRAAAPVTKGERLGTLTGYLNEEKIGTVGLVAAESIERTPVATVWLWIRSTLAVTTLAFLGFITYGTKAAKAARRRRRGFTSRG
jgi:hypothetical protein